MSDDIWFGINEAAESRDFDTASRMCLNAEKYNFDFFGYPDHFMDPGIGRGAPLECWTTLAGLAAITNRIRITPLVSCYGYRAPTVLAKMATTVDIISNGRLIFGIGAGWHKEEFNRYMGRFPPVSERLKGLEETVEICKGMFMNEFFSYNGSLFQIKDALNSTRPVQKQIPILVGGGGEKVTLKIAAKHADISHFHPHFNLERVKRKLSALKEHCKSVGRDYDEIRKGIGFGIIIGCDEDEIMAKVKQIMEITGKRAETSASQSEFVKMGTPEMITKQLHNYVDMGFDFFSLTFAPYNTSEDFRLFAEEVMPQF